MDMARSTHRNLEMRTQFLLGLAEGKNPLETPMHRWRIILKAKIKCRVLQKSFYRRFRDTINQTLAENDTEKAKEIGQKLTITVFSARSSRFGIALRAFRLQYAKFIRSALYWDNTHRMVAITDV
jgi:hypothetical protein